MGGLHLDTTVESLKDHFKEYGEITDAVVIKDPNTKRSRGFGFITFETSKSVDACLEGRPHELDGREVEVKQAIPREDNNPMAHTRSVELSFRCGQIIESFLGYSTSSATSNCC